MEGGSNDDDLDLVNDLLHWQMEDYELFLSYNMLGVQDGKEENEFLKEYREVKEGEAWINEMLVHTFSEDKPIKYEEPKIKTINLGNEVNPKKNCGR